jgi:glycosyltransferase involved in cell wall biosynthesis
MSKVLFLIDSLEHNGPATQMSSLARAVLNADHRAVVCVLGRDGPLSANFTDARIPVETLGWTRWLSLGAFRRLYHVVDSFSPDVLHAWGSRSLRAAFLATRRRPCRVVASRPLPPGRKRCSPFDRWLLRQVDQVVAGSQVEARRLIAFGVDPTRLTVVPPGVESSTSVAVTAPPFKSGPFLLCVGPFTPENGHYYALWSFEIFHYLFREHRLVLVGEGPEKPHLECMVRGLGARRNIHFLGTTANVTELIRRADLVWVPSRAAGGVQVTLEALAAGTPAIATRVPELVELLGPFGEDLLVPAGDQPALVRQSRRLLEDVEFRRQLVGRGRRWVEKSFTTEQLVRRYVGLYQKRAG